MLAGFAKLLQLNLQEPRALPVTVSVGRNAFFWVHLDILPLL